MDLWWWGMSMAVLFGFALGKGWGPNLCKLVFLPVRLAFRRR